VGDLVEVVNHGKDVDKYVGRKFRVQALHTDPVWSSDSKRYSTEIAVILADPETNALVCTRPIDTLRKLSGSEEAEYRAAHSSVGRSDRGDLGAEEVIFGRPQHEKVLARAFDEAAERVVIVTPFIRGRMRNQQFRSSLYDALQRGVRVYVIHGMPALDDTENENRRISELRKFVGPLSERLRFVRVTDTVSVAMGDHSKILLCDDRWAVVTSFNWLSIQKSNETGTLVQNKENIAKLLAKYAQFLR
jgi:phosphatidylserine/phosphatidylglycerophosphate/cardiolipin synthase-like enzyme